MRRREACRGSAVCTAVHLSPPGHRLPPRSLSTAMAVAGDEHPLQQLPRAEAPQPPDNDRAFSGPPAEALETIGRGPTSRPQTTMRALPLRPMILRGVSGWPQRPGTPTIAASGTPQGHCPTDSEGTASAFEPLLRCRACDRRRVGSSTASRPLEGSTTEPLA